MRETKRDSICQIDGRLVAEAVAATPLFANRCVTRSREEQRYRKSGPRASAAVSARGGPHRVDREPGACQNGKVLRQFIPRENGIDA